MKLRHYITILLVLAIGVVIYAQNPVSRDYACTAQSATGTQAYACSLTVAPASYAAIQGKTVTFQSDVANTAAATLNLNSLGAITIKKRSSGTLTDLAANDIGANQYVQLKYDGTYFQMMSQLGNTSGGGGSTTDWSDPSNVLIVESFFPSSNSTALIGSLGWALFGTGGTIAGITGVANHAGGYSLTAAATINDTAAIDLSGSTGVSSFPPVSAETNWTIVWKLSTPASLSQVSVLAGLQATHGAQAYDTGGAWIRYSNASTCTGSFLGTAGTPTTDSTWVGESRNSSTSSLTASLGTIATSTGYWLRIRSTSAGTILYAVKPDGGSYGSELSLNTNVLTGAGVPFIKVTTCETVAKAINVREFRYVHTSLN